LHLCMGCPTKTPIYIHLCSNIHLFEENYPMVIFPAPRTDIKNAGQVQSRWHGDCRKGDAGDGVDGGN
jgi:hypothetical protein